MTNDYGIHVHVGYQVFKIHFLCALWVVGNPLNAAMRLHSGTNPQ